MRKKQIIRLRTSVYITKANTFSDRCALKQLYSNYIPATFLSHLI